MNEYFVLLQMENMETPVQYLSESLAQWIYLPFVQDLYLVLTSGEKKENFLTDLFYSVP